MLKVSWAQNLVLIFFSVLLVEVLTPATLVLITLGLSLVFLNIKTTKPVRNIFAVIVFLSYWLTYGKIIDPEIGLNFLTSIIVLKILERETTRDQYMIFFGLLLLISAGSLFERTITYVVFFAISFLVLVQDFYFHIGLKWRLKELALSLLWVLPLTFCLFFLVPRMMNPIPFQSSSNQEGEIGYTPDVQISQIESLSSNTHPVFQVLASRPLKQDELYWRGNTLSYNDGWNWNVMLQDRAQATNIGSVESHSSEVHQTFRLFNRDDYFFTLDSPRTISYGKRNLELRKMKTLMQERWQWVQRYEVQSDPRGYFENTENIDPYLTLHLPKKTKLWIQENFKGNSAKELEEEVRAYFRTHAFSYSLNPGRSVSFEDFMIKKVGFCSHYASSLALILRAKNIPARLVSGFMGGSYNRFADFYLISQNDAHVWVEVLVDNNWQRIDPTEWIAPDRVRLGGEAFMESVSEGALGKNSWLRGPRFIQDMKQWFSQWDFHFYLWLEEMDYHNQEAWLSRLKFKREWLFSIVPFTMLLFMGIYSAYLALQRKGEKEPDYQRAWKDFSHKMKKRGITLSGVSLSESQKSLEESSLENKEELLEILKELIRASFGHGELKEIQKRIRNL